HTDDVFFVTLAPDGATLASGCHDGTVRLWDVAGGKEIRPCGSGHAGGAICCAFAPDGRTLVSGGYDKTIRVWEVATGRERLSLSDGPADRPAVRAELDKAGWTDLASEDARIAHRAVWALAASPRGVALL